MRPKLSVTRGPAFLLLLLAALALIPTHRASAAPVEAGAPFLIEREGRTIAVEPYGPNIVRITLSTRRADALGAPGYGFTGRPSASGWSQATDANGYTVLRSDRMVVRLAPEALSRPEPMPLDPLNQALRNTYFGGPPSPGRFTDMLAIETAAGKPLLTMHRWSMIANAAANPAANPAAGGAAPAGDAGYRVAATFDAPADEHVFGLGQHQAGLLDLRGHQIHCWHDYGAIGGETVCVPFVVSTRGYGLIWDNPSKTTVDLAINQQSQWSSDIGERVSFFVIAGARSDEIYQGYRQLTGATPLLPRGGYGYIQSKAIYPTQDQALAVAKGYRDRALPLDTLVVDFLNATRQGELDLDPARWPDPAGMNRTLHAMGVRSMLSVWPHFAPGTRYYDMLLQKGWLIRDVNGVPDHGGYKPDAIGPNIDTTNPDAARWWWEAIRDRYIKPYGFDDIWLDETEPDIDPANDIFSIGSGKRYYNVYPLFHTASVYEGNRRDFGDSRRIMILARAAYLGAQRNGTVFWSSDIVSNWDMLKRSIPAGLNFSASGMPYWDTDIAGFFSPSLPATYRPEHPPLIDPSDVRDNVGRFTDYPELFVRWFEWGSFQPIMRAHGERMHNEVWSYGKQAEPILSSYLRLRYRLLPYIYSLGYRTYQSGAPIMRALFMDFPEDPNALDLKDEYMFGPAFLVAPVVEQGATSRKVYLPAGADWYDYWTNRRFSGGQWIEAAAPIETIPLFVRAGSIVPLGSAITGASKDQVIETLRVYPGADAAFTLFSDDGTSYRYEHGAGSVTTVQWDDRAQKLRYSGTLRQPKQPKVEVVSH
ncbi:glycoside hydrolase family 31 protein [Sphingomonas morindae]|uniref:Glycoside hydrolase family 31 protein n=1 Tax=Sphingomonas morindae TaxID=1541170 RepID=A0ABY4X7A0_9SPHN|nr:glycoside hydrolase family 31 protein [Sphingomonas morindae]USI72790.1 glycoside hydrolase family 31 protein [Sphingomonas morindae]